MKRILTLFLAALLCGTTACTSAPAGSDPSDVSVILNVGDDLREPVVLQEDSKEYVCENGKVAMTSLIQYDVLKDGAINSAAIPAINARIAEEAARLRAEADEMSKPAVSAEENGELARAYFANYTISAVFLTDAYVVFTEEGEIYSGGMHPQDSLSAFNFSAQDGAELTLDDLFVQDAGVYLPRLRTEVTRQIETKRLAGEEDGSLFYENYADALVLTTFEKRWYLTADGLCLVFAPYEIAPYTAGVLTFTVPYDAIADLLADKKIG